jgi:hypothetical protein
MKTRAALISTFALILFASFANAQGGRLYIGTDVGVFVRVAQSGDLATVTLPAGEAMKFRIAGGGVKDQKLVRLQIPCEGGGAAGHPYEHVLTKSKNMYLVATQPSWRSSCHLLTMKLGNEPEYRVKVRFN